jgi:hypothetical protein
MLQLTQLENRDCPTNFFTSVGGTIRHYSDNNLVDQFQPYRGYLGDIAIEVDNNKLLTVPTTNSPAHLKIFDLSTKEELNSFYAFEPTFLGGINVDIKDNEVLVGAKTVNHVKLYNLDRYDGNEVRSFYAGPITNLGVDVSFQPEVSREGTFPLPANPTSPNSLKLEFLPSVPLNLQIAIFNRVTELVSGLNVNVNINTYNDVTNNTTIYVGEKKFFNIDAAISDQTIGIANPSGYFQRGKTDFLDSVTYVFIDGAGYSINTTAAGIVHEWIHTLGIFTHSSELGSIFAATIGPFSDYIDAQTLALVKSRLK